MHDATPRAAGNAAILLDVRSVMYRNLPFGVVWMSAAQISLSVLRGGGPPGAPTAPRGAPGPSLESEGSPDAVLTSVSKPVLASSASVVTVPTSSLSRYTNLLSGDVMKWGGPVDAFISATEGGLDVRRPEFASKANWKIASL